MKPSKLEESRKSEDVKEKIPTPKINKKTVLRLLRCMTEKYKFHFMAVFLCIIISAGVGVAGSVFIQSVIDDYIAPLLLEENPVFTGLLHAIFMMIIVYLVGIFATLFYNRMMVTISQGTLKQIRDDMFAHMQTLPIKYFDTHSFGDVMSRYTNDTDTLRQMIAISVPQMFSSVVTMIAVTVAMLVLNLPLTALSFICIFFMLWVMKKLAGKSSAYFIRQQAALGDVNGYIEEMTNGQYVIKTFCHEEYAKAEFDIKNDDLFEQSTVANRFANIIMPIMANIGILQYVLIAIVGGLLAANEVAGITMGVIGSFLILSKSFSQPVGQISTQINSIIMALAGATRIFELMDEEPEKDEGYVTLVNAAFENGKIVEHHEYTGLWAWKYPHHDGSITYTELKGDVQLSDVEFGYEEDKLVLHGISLYAKPGQKIAFIGTTGAGKTTITNLINRFYDITKGEIRFDGININKIKKIDLRRSLGMVLQETNLFTGTVMENIRYGNLNASEEDVIRAAKTANAHEFINRLPDGYQTVIEGDGGTLSQGERQLISIARVAVANPPVMILDEATSSIDTRTEVFVQQGMDQLMQGRTVFVIAHRLSTVQDAKVIVVLEHGRIIERGTHEALLAEKGKYYQLYTGAFAKNE